MNDLTNLWDPKLPNFKTLVRIDGEESWAWKLLDNVNIPSANKTILENIFKE